MKLRLSWMVFLALAGYSPSSFGQADDPIPTAIRKSGEIRVAAASSPPYLVVSPTGEATGYDADIINLALKGMGLPAMKALLLANDALIPALQAHQVDLVAPDLGYTEARCKAVVFTGPVYASQDGVYVPIGNPKHLTGYSSVAQSQDVKLAVVRGSLQEAFALKQGVKPEQLVRVTDIAAGIATIRGGRANAFALGQFTIPNPEQKSLEVVVDKQSPVNGVGVAFRMEDIRFRDAFDKQFDLLRSNGAMKEIYPFPNWDVLSKVHRASELVPSCK
ncbi:hypothetical protein AS156_16005 [Bradyrhizobium macuxiense]|uniref:Solute-binding protein family 3/N-terminal domain-containing protein n=2 Tax=Bradyrhizobium macuxiense TaxID=1755647 RepID=A0A120FJR5_9BRAD|nr:hypothetical protein AS156_16005 [Bradyrhizobium macuxiense]